MDDKLDKIEQHLSNIDVTLAKQSVILDIHVKRTNQLEDRVIPVEKYIVQSNAILKFLGFIATLVGLGEVLIRLLK